MCQGDSGRFNVPVIQRCKESKIHLDDVMLLHTSLLGGLFCEGENLWEMGLEVHCNSVL